MYDQGTCGGSIEHLFQRRWETSSVWFSDNTAGVLDVATRAPMYQALTGHTDSVWSVAISGDGSRVVSGSDHDTVRVSAVATGMPACEALTGYTDWLTSVAMSGGGSQVLSGSYGKTVRVWDVATEYCLLVTSSFKLYETVARYCGCIEQNGEATSSEEECERYYFDGKAFKFQRGNGTEEVLAQLELEPIFRAQLEVDINSRKGVVVTGNLNGEVGIFRIIK